VCVCVCARVGVCVCEVVSECVRLGRRPWDGKERSR
jgi:hypothetical protein